MTNTPKAYYNENDPRAAAWLRELIAAGLIAAGDVDERSIAEVQADELAGYCQCHFFAGIGGWSLALRLAGVGDDEPCVTGSCPCQPFSAAGKRKGKRDARHLWPEFYRIIRAGHARGHAAFATLFGEQVASKAGRGWLSGVRAELEALGHAVGAADLCAAGAGAPHIRQRLWWVAYAGHAERWSVGEHRQDGVDGKDGRWAQTHGESGARGEVCDLGHPAIAASQQFRVGEPRDLSQGAVGRSGARGGVPLADTDRAGRRELRGRLAVSQGLVAAELRSASRGWTDFEVIPCLDGKARRIEPGTFPLAHGVPGRVGLLRGYGNAIVPQVAAEFIRAALEARGDMTTPFPTP